MKRSFLSRRLRNPHQHDEPQKEQPFFSKANDTKPEPFFRAAGHAEPVQAKLAIGQPGDKYEQEADAVADHAVNGQNQTPAVQRRGISAIQRSDLATPVEDEKLSTAESRMEKDKLIQEKAAAQMPSGSADMMEDKKKKPVQMQSAGIPAMEDKKKKPVQLQPVSSDKMEDKEKKLQAKANPSSSRLQREADSGGATASPQLSSRIEDSSGKGKPLPGKTRAEMESAIGTDFSGVNIHTDASAVQMNEELGAQAFTHGRDVYFNSGKYSPENSSGQHLLAHELTHTLQQGTNGLPAHNGVQTSVQRVHIENGRKKFDCPGFAGDLKLEACLNDEDRLSPGETGAAVIKIQDGLQKDGLDLGKDETKGVYSSGTGKAVLAFKQKHKLGSTQFPDVGPGTTKKLDELCAAKPPTPTPKPPGDCGPGTANPFCLPIPATDAPCQPFPDIVSAEVLRDGMSIVVPRLCAAKTLCPEVKPVWETYFAATSKPFQFDDPSGCVVKGAKTDPDASAEANRIAKGHLEDILDNLPITLQGVKPSAFPFPGRPIAERRMPLGDAIAQKLRGFLHHPSIIYNAALFNGAANIAGGAGIEGKGSDIFGDDDRLVGGTVIIEVNAIDPTSGRMSGQVRWRPHIHVKDTVDLCPGNLTNSIIIREFTVPMSKLEAMGLTRDVPFTIDYDLDVQQSNFSVLPAREPITP